jgi:nucleotide-binding universal stress UspA family protein
MGSQVTALGVLEHRQPPSRAALMAALDEAKKYLQAKGIQAKTGILHGNPAEALIDFASENQPSLMVVGAKGLHATLGILLGRGPISSWRAHGV